MEKISVSPKTGFSKNIYMSDLSKETRKATGNYIQNPSLKLLGNPTI